MSDSDIEEAVRAILKASAELSRAQAALEATPDLTTAPRDFAARKVCDAFRAFESAAKAITKPTRITLARVLKRRAVARIETTSLFLLYAFARE